MNITSDRTKAIQIAREKIGLSAVYLDTETTGFRNTDEIVEISIIDHDGSVLIDTLVKPLGKIPADATNIHGITNEMVQDARGWPEVWEEVEVILKDRPVGIYNAEFDIRLMEQTHQKHWIGSKLDSSNFFCIMRLYAQFYGEWNAQQRGLRVQVVDAAR